MNVTRVKVELRRNYNDDEERRVPGRRLACDERLLGAFNKAVEQAGIKRECNERRYYEKPSEKRRRKLKQRAYQRELEQRKSQSGQKRYKRKNEE